MDYSGACYKEFQVFYEAVESYATTNFQDPSSSINQYVSTIIIIVTFILLLAKQCLSFVEKIFVCICIDSKLIFSINMFKVF